MSCLHVKWAAVLAAASIWLDVGSRAQAAVTFNLDTVITGDSPASATMPWLTARFESQANNRVKLTLSAPNLVGTEDVDQWLFNIDPVVIEDQLDTLYILKATSLVGDFNVGDIRLIRQAVDGVTRAGFTFDFDFGFPSGNPNNRFMGGDVVEIILGTSVSAAYLPLTEGVFNYRDETGTYYSAAHIRRTSGWEGSGWIGTSTAIPEQTTIIAAALLLLPFCASTLRFLRKSR